MTSNNGNEGTSAHVDAEGCVSVCMRIHSVKQHCNSPSCCETLLKGMEALRDVADLQVVERCEEDGRTRLRATKVR